MNYVAFRKQPVPQQFQAGGALVTKTYLAPTLGWISATNIAAAPELSAHTLENCEATPRGVRLRFGDQQHGRCHATLPVESLMAYIGGATRKMFAGCNGGIFNMTAPADPDIAPAADVSGQTSNYYSSQNFATSGGNYMYAVNGSDFAQLYDGTSWAAVTAVSGIAITGVVTSTLSHVLAYRQRLFFVQKNTMNAWALPVGSVGGAAVQINLAGVFTKGGAVLTGATWSMDAGDGLDDKIVFISTEGEAAVYEGSNPADANDWRIVGVYDITPPLGKRAFVRDGGELLIATEKALIPISIALAAGNEVAAANAKSIQIQPDWEVDAAARRGLPWEIVKWPSRNRVYVTTPVTGTSTPTWCYGANTTDTNWRWFKNTGWDMRCAVLHNDIVYFGTNSGTVMQADVSGSDDGDIIPHLIVLPFEFFEGEYKTAKQARTIWQVGNEIEVKTSVSVDFRITLPAAPNVAPITGSPGVWDVGLWDVALWDAGDSLEPYDTGWVAVGKSGKFAVAPQIQVSSGQESASIAQIAIIQVQYEGGGLVV